MALHTRIDLPGMPSAGAGFEQPFEMLDACHERVERSLRLLRRLITHETTHGPDAQVRQAAHDVLRYFDLAAPAHHEDEERHVFPLLRAHGPASLATVIQRLQADHVEMAGHWQRLRPLLLALHERGERLPGHAAEIAAAFARCYDRHIACERDEVFPAARALADDARLAEMGQDMAARRGAPVAAKPR